MRVTMTDQVGCMDESLDGVCIGTVSWLWVVGRRRLVDWGFISMRCFVVVLGVIVVVSLVVVVVVVMVVVVTGLVP